MQGYVEGEYVYIASPFAGQLETLSVQRGAQVKLADRLFALDDPRTPAALEYFLMLANLAYEYEMRT